VPQCFGTGSYLAKLPCPDLGVWSRSLSIYGGASSKATRPHERLDNNNEDSEMLVALLAAAISGIPGYLLSYRFWRSHYSATNKSGDFGSPRGGFFAMVSGIFIGMLTFSILGRFDLVAADAVGTGMIVAMIVGMIAGVIGMVRGQKARSQPPK
jgi:hypothetical protein